MKERFICGAAGADFGTDVLSMTRAFSQATKNLGERAAYWVVLRQQRFLQKLSKKTHDRLFSSTTFYCPLISEEEQINISSSRIRYASRPHLRAASVRRKHRIRRRSSHSTCRKKEELKRLISEVIEPARNESLNTTPQCFIVENKLYFLTKSNGESNLDKTGLLLRNFRTIKTHISFAGQPFKLCKYCCCSIGSRRKSRRVDSNYRKRRKLLRKVSTTPVVPPRTRSASQQHQQNLGSFNPPFRNQAYHHHPTASVQKNHDLNSKNGFNNNLNNTPIPLVLNNQPRQPLVKQIPSPVLTSTNNFSTQPQSLHKPATNFIHSKYAQTNTNLGNLSKGVKLPPPPDIPKAKIISNTPHSASKIQHPTAILNGKAITVSPLKVQTLGLGSGKFVPMNNLYKSLLEEPYFHPVVRNVLPNLLTKDCMFLVRPSTHSQHPLTLSLQEKGKIFNISIRLRSDAKYSLGTEKVGEMAFLSVGDMIEFYRNEPIKLEDGSLTYLKWSPSKEDDYIQPE